MRTTLMVRMALAVCSLVAWSTAARASIPASERQVLLSLYASTNGAGCITSTNLNGVTGTECRWHGIACDSTQGHVITVALSSNNNFSGTLPSLGAVAALQNFYVEHNQLTGSIPDPGGLAALQSCRAPNEQLTGTIPDRTGRSF